MDKLVDSLNGSALFDNKKPLKSVVQLDKETPHIAFWRHAIETLSTFRLASNYGAWLKVFQGEKFPTGLVGKFFWKNPPEGIQEQQSNMLCVWLYL
ncbi:hypothetical protein ABEB36_009277 [Hypothenemus hampei]|uniref:Uncharacterized protein n=1 Tax=Hypothenemus hampei TaxID=57062 RepID=A0ABD1EGD5_HYPHA